MTIQNEGTFYFELDPGDADWATNEQTYRFRRTERDGIAVATIKYPDRTLEIVVEGPLSRTFVFRTAIPIPAKPRNYAKVVLSWKFPEVRLFINGEKVSTMNVRPQSVDITNIKLQYNRLVRHHSAALKDKDPISFLDLSHALRIWVDMKGLVDTIAKENGVSLGLTNPLVSKDLKRLLKGRTYTHLPLRKV